MFSSPTHVAVATLILVMMHTVLASSNPMSQAQQFMDRSWANCRSVPALSTRRLNKFLSQSVQEISTKQKKRRPAEQEQQSVGFYYGIPDIVIPTAPKKRPRKRESLSRVMGDTLEELREMRQEMEALRREMSAMKRRMGGGVAAEEEEEEESPVSAMLARRRRQRDFDRIGMEVEQWAEQKLFKEGGEEDGWKEIHCNKMVRNKFNKNGTIKCYLKWMKDSRGTHATPEDDREYPCIKCYATLDAPMEDVCKYLSNEAHMPEYNDLMVANRDLEEVSPHSKICWGQAPQILFIKPRDFVTYCHHRWLRDGSQVVVNQACEHPDAPANHDEKSDKVCRARALRGANFISKDPDDPDNKTRIAILAHADPGGIPQWACKTAVNAVAPIEPFKLFYRIGKNVKNMGPQLEQQRTEMVHSVPGRTGRPAGLSQMGYACFWPNGGGLTEGVLHPSHPDHNVDPSEHHHHDDDD